MTKTNFKNNISAGICRTFCGNGARELQFALRKIPALVLCLMPLLLLDSAYAGTGGDEFADVWSTLKDWIQGTLGRVVCGSMILVGIVAGVARQSISAFAVGIGGGIGLYNTPTVIESVLSASVTEPEVASYLMQY